MPGETNNIKWKSEPQKPKIWKRKWREWKCKTYPSKKFEWKLRWSSWILQMRQSEECTSKNWIAGENSRGDQTSQHLLAATTSWAMRTHHLPFSSVSSPSSSPPQTKGMVKRGKKRFLSVRFCVSRGSYARILGNQIETVWLTHHLLYFSILVVVCMYHLLS